MSNYSKKDIDFEISRLLAKKITGALNNQEFYQLNQWLNDPKNQHVSKKIEDKNLFKQKIEQYHNEDVDAAFEKFVNKRKQKSRKIILRRTLIAASLLLPLIYFIPQYIQGPQTPEVANTEIEHHVIDKSKPRLILADDSQIILDGTTAVNNVPKKGVLVGDNFTLDYTKSNLIPEDKSQFNILEIPAKYTYKLILSDGSKVWLNSVSSLKYPVQFGQKDRIVEAEGELFFEIKKDLKRPFYVITNGVKVEVTGTKFNVNSYNNEPYSHITLSEGSVNIHSNVGKHKLTPGLQFKIDRNQTKYSIKKVNLNEYISWKDGTYIFRNKNIDEVLLYAQRWFNVDILFINQTAKYTKFTGLLNKEESLEEFLLRLQSTSKLNFKKRNNQLIIF
ncbi:FecR family protein [Sphingobacterium bovistauri]|uniref:FecR family protein n=1 Tax=Sphingobacterium bovistauri TaxID=2781959 RepID=A0ABS7Z3T6_9SPHI|nr:FecR family protein [Sphingobacterium bovistauri]MCA5003639.1 FecR family protein [Sphingobacterium bovistauri]